MSEEHGKPFKPFEVVGDEALEARIVAWVLGEASEFEVDELKRLCRERPELEVFRQRIEAVHGLAGESVAKLDADWKLPAGKRGKVLERIGVGADLARRERSSRFAARRVLLAAAACLVLTVAVAALVFPMFFGARAGREGSPEAAARMAQHNAAMELAGVEAEMNALEMAMREQGDRVEEKRKVLNTIVETKGIVYGGGNGGSGGGAAGTGEDMSARSSAPNGDRLKALQKERKDAAVKKGIDTHDFAEAREEFEQSREMFDKMRIEYQGSKLALEGRKAELAAMTATSPAGAVTDQSFSMDRPATAAPVAPAEQLLRETAQTGAGGMVPLETALPKELIEGTPRPIVLPGLARGESKLAPGPAPEPAAKPAAPAPSAPSASTRGPVVTAGSAPADRKLGLKPAGDAGGTGGGGPVDGKSPTKELAPMPGDVAATSRLFDNRAAEPGNERFRRAGVGEAGGEAVTRDSRDVVLNNTGRAGGSQQGNGRMNQNSDVAGFHYADGEAGMRGDGRWEDSDRDGSVAADPFSVAGGSTKPDAPGPAAAPVAGPAADPGEGGGQTTLGSDWTKRVEKAGEVAGQVADLRGRHRDGNAVKSGAQSGMQPQQWGMIPPPEPQSAVRQLQLQMAEVAEVAGGDGLQGGSGVEAGQPAETEFKIRSIEVGRGFVERLNLLDEDKVTEEADPFEAPADSNHALLRRQSAGDMLLDHGLQLPEGASVSYNAENGTLSVKAPDEALSDLQKFIDALPLPPSTDEVIDLMAEVAAADEPFSTFSLHVSQASFQVAVAALERGERPDPETVRPEEFYNAFDYGDPAPTAGEPVACAIEQCAHPLLPSRNLVRVAVRTAAAGRGAGQALRLTVLLDSSGSMEREDRRAAVQAAMVQLASLLGEQDVVTVAGFARQPRLLVDRLSGEALKKELEGLVERTPAEGGTNLEQALALADELAMRQFDPAAQNRIVLLTDGAANLGNADPELLAKRVEGLRQRGISFDAAGFGTAGLNDRMLERLTRDGDGRYCVVDGPKDADEQFAKRLAGAFRPAAENVKVQVRFNPARVGGYRLIGFEEHRLKKEDFRDDKVDAAEMAAEEAGVAVYQVELLPEGEGEIGEVSVRFRDAASGRMVERSWTMPHDGSAPSFDQAPASMQIAGLALLAADVLRDGPLAPLTDWRELAPVSNRVRAEFGGSENVGRLLRMVEKLRE